MTKKSNIFVFLLIVLVAAPLDTAVASWMALGMSSASQQGFMPAQDVHAGHSQEMGHQHDAHDEEVCDEHCMNCSSHCFSPGLLSVVSIFGHRDRQILGNLRSHALYRADLLFRPPISA